MDKPTPLSYFLTHPEKCPICDIFAFMRKNFFTQKHKRDRLFFYSGSLSIVKKATTGYAGGHKEFHLWIEKENLR